MKAEIAAFLTSRRAAGCAAATLRLYEWTLGKLQEAMPGGDPGADDLLGLMAELPGAPETRHGHWRRLATFFRWRQTRYSGLENPFASVPAPRRRVHQRRALSVVEMGRLVAVAESHRDRALVALLLDTGMRVGEAYGLRRRDVDGDIATVAGKTGARLVPVSEHVRLLIMALPASNPWGVSRVESLGQVIKRLGARAGLAPLGPHCLRHTFATRWLRGGGDVFALQAILGHSQLQTTQRYAHPGLDHILAQHRRFSPLSAPFQGLQTAFWTHSSLPAMISSEEAFHERSPGGFAGPAGGDR